MLHFFYSLCFRIALPFVIFRLWWLGRKNPDGFVHWQERLGFVAPSREPVIWVHAVSVGETIAAAPLVRALLRRNPDIPILMTAMTATGSARAKALFGENVRYAFSPYDTPGAVRRFVDRIQPRALVIMETELWPNMIALSYRRNVPIFLINARLSERSAKKYKRVASSVQPLLRSIRWIAAQAAEDANRFLDIGAEPAAVSRSGERSRLPAVSSLTWKYLTKSEPRPSLCAQGSAQAGRSGLLPAPTRGKTARFLRPIGPY